VFAGRVIALALLALGLVPLAESKDIAVVSNKSNAVASLTMAELVKICKGQTSRWPDGKAVMIVVRDPGSPEMKLVLEKVYGMTKDDVTALIATANHGRTSHPAIMVVDSDEAVVKRVESTTGAVGLVDVYSITGGVNVLKVGGKLPMEPGYPIHGN
jgi:ABC-type phosphate transport system substrate-binding protein